jgi:N-carbamoyl-L-amino-acid hydrolase
MTDEMKIDGARLSKALADLAQVGALESGGVSRLAASDEDREARDLVVSWMRAAELEIKVDRVGNVFGIRAGDAALPPVMTGSHLDTVKSGGALDGSYGVLAGLEVMRTLNERAVQTRHPLVVAIFTNEEGVRFTPDMMGSLAFAGGIEAETVLAARDETGTSLGEALDTIGYAGKEACGWTRPHAFVELHIEQGPILEREGITIGAVENLQGISWTEIVITGEANHAGTTPIALRKDAGYVACATVAFLRDLCREIGPATRATCGVVELQPGVTNVVAGRALLRVDLRHPDNARLEEAEARLSEYLHRIAEQEGVTCASRSLARFDPVTFDAGIVEVVESRARSLGYSVRRMTSGAGHDAQMIARIAPTAMIFVPSQAGVSHNPGEFTSPRELEAGANVLLHTLSRLAS